MKAPALFRAFKVLFFGAAAVVGGACAAQTAAQVWTLSATKASQYMYRGVRLGGPSVQPDVQYDSGNLTAGLWSSVPVVDKVPGQSDPEIDGYGWYKISVRSDLSVQPGFTLYTFPHADPGHGFYRLTFEPNIAVNYTVRGLTVTPKVYYDVVLSGLTYELNAAYALPVRQIGSELDFYASVGTYEWRSAISHAAPDVKARGNYWSMTATLPFQVSTHAKLIASVGYTEGSNNTFKAGTAPKYRNPAAVGRAVVTLGYSFTW